MSDADRSAPAVAIVEPQTPGNIGTIARAMKNFGFRELLLIDPPELESGGEAYGFAGQARHDILPNHRQPSFETLVGEYHTVGFTAIPGANATNPTRYPVQSPAELATELATVDTSMALVFGREDNGLRNEELAKLDQLCSIPAAPEYPVLNLGQAATIALYELQTLATDETQLPDQQHDRANDQHIEQLYTQFDAFLQSLGHPTEKRDKTKRLFRRLVGRAHPTDREAITLTGLFRRGAQFVSPPTESQED